MVILLDSLDGFPSRGWASPGRGVAATPTPGPGRPFFGIPAAGEAAPGGTGEGHRQPRHRQYANRGGPLFRAVPRLCDSTVPSQMAIEPGALGTGGNQPYGATGSRKERPVRCHRRKLRQDPPTPPAAQTKPRAQAGPEALPSGAVLPWGGRCQGSAQGWGREGEALAGEGGQRGVFAAN